MGGFKACFAIKVSLMINLVTETDFLFTSLFWLAEIGLDPLVSILLHEKTIEHLDKKIKDWKGFNELKPKIQEKIKASLQIEPLGHFTEYTREKLGDALKTLEFSRALTESQTFPNISIVEHLSQQLGAIWLEKVSSSNFPQQIHDEKVATKYAKEFLSHFLESIFHILPPNLQIELTIEVEFLKLFSAVRTEYRERILGFWEDIYPTIGIIGRTEELKALTDWALNSDERFAVLLSRPKGGKTALLAKWLRAIRNQSRDIIYFTYVPLARNAFSTYDELLSVLCDQLQFICGFTPLTTITRDTLPTLLRRVNKIAGANNKKVVLILDGIDFILRNEGFDPLFQLPLLPNIRVLLSCNMIEDIRTARLLLHRLYPASSIKGSPCLEIRIGSITSLEIENFVDMLIQKQVVDQAMRSKYISLIAKFKDDPVLLNLLLLSRPEKILPINSSIDIIAENDFSDIVRNWWNQHVETRQISLSDSLPQNQFLGSLSTAAVLLEQPTNEYTDIEMDKETIVGISSPAIVSATLPNVLSRISPFFVQYDIHTYQVPERLYYLSYPRSRIFFYKEFADGKYENFLRRLVSLWQNEIEVRQTIPSPLPYFLRRYYSKIVTQYGSLNDVSSIPTITLFFSLLSALDTNDPSFFEFLKYAWSFAEQTSQKTLASKDRLLITTITLRSVLLWNWTWNLIYPHLLISWYQYQPKRVWQWIGAIASIPTNQDVLYDVIKMLRVHIVAEDIEEIEKVWDRIATPVLRFSLLSFLLETVPDPDTLPQEGYLQNRWKKLKKSVLREALDYWNEPEKNGSAESLTPKMLLRFAELIGATQSLDLLLALEEKDYEWEPADQRRLKYLAYLIDRRNPIQVKQASLLRDESRASGDTTPEEARTTLQSPLGRDLIDKVWPEGKLLLQKLPLLQQVEIVIEGIYRNSDVYSKLLPYLFEELQKLPRTEENLSMIGQLIIVFPKIPSDLATQLKKGVEHFLKEPNLNRQDTAYLEAALTVYGGTFEEISQLTLELLRLSPIPYKSLRMLLPVLPFDLLPTVARHAREFPWTERLDFFLGLAWCETQKYKHSPKELRTYWSEFKDAYRYVFIPEIELIYFKSMIAHLYAIIEPYGDLLQFSQDEKRLLDWANVFRGSNTESDVYENNSYKLRDLATGPRAVCWQGLLQEFMPYQKRVLDIYGRYEILDQKRRALQNSGVGDRQIDIKNQENTQLESDILRVRDDLAVNLDLMKNLVLNVLQTLQQLYLGINQSQDDRMHP
jgi:hypothetical protein